MNENKKDQLDLFSNFFLKNSPDWSQSLELYDSIPKFNYHRVTKTTTPKIIEKKCNHRGKAYDVELVPGIIKDKAGKTWAAIAGKREELVMHALRYIALQNLAEVKTVKKLEKGSNQESSSETAHVKVMFTIHQIRNELTRMGHGYKWSEIDEALEILSSAVIKITSKKYFSKGSIIESMFGINDEKGSRCVIFHPLASQAILSGASRKIRYDKLMKLKKPLSRWIYMRLCHFLTNAQQPKSFSRGIGLKISYDEVYEQSGLQELKERRNNVRTIRQALEELKEANILHDGIVTGEAWVETKGQLWEAFPSNKTVSDIITANKEGGTRPQDKLVTD